GINEVVGEIGKRPIDVGGKNIENCLGAGCETFYAQSPVQENRPDVGRGHEVVKVRVRAAQLFDAALQLVIDSRQLFVDRLQFLLTRLELFRSGTHLLV